jgi:hypothetical protein
MNKLTSTHAYRLHQKLISLKHAVEASGILMGQMLYEIQEKELFKTLGYDTFEQYLADPELSFGRATAYKLKKIYKQWVLDYGYNIDELEKIGQERLLEAGKVATPENQKEWLIKATSLSMSDLVLEVRETAGNDGHTDFVPAPRLIRCAVCGKWKSLDNDLMCKC